MGDWIELQCPYCFECQEIFIEIDLAGALVQDCEVCCNPWQLRVHRDRDTQAVSVSIERL